MRKISFFFLLIFCFSFCKNEKPKVVATSKLTPPISTVDSEPIIAPTDPFIKKYEGMIGSQFPIELVLINWSNGTLGGYYFYKKENQTPQKIELTGELNLNETFVLDEYVEDKFTGKFQGSLSELSIINGYWSNADSSKSMNYSLKEIPVQDKTGWTGSWYRNDLHSPGLLILGNVTDKTMDFGLEVFNGGHNGVIEGTANLNGGMATFKNPVFDQEENCFLVFQKNKNQIRIIQKSDNWACGFGMRAHANGKYDNRLEPQKIELSYGNDNSIFTDKSQHDAFAKLVGEDYESFAFNMQNHTTIEEHPQDKFNAKVFVGAVTGLATLNEAVIMRNDDNHFWAAVIVLDEINDDFQVKYFTNDNRMKGILPSTIEEWRKRFEEYPIVL